MPNHDYIIFIDGSYNDVKDAAGIGARLINCHNNKSKNFWEYKERLRSSQNVEESAFYLAIAIIKKYKLKNVKIYTDNSTVACKFKDFKVLLETDSSVLWRRRDSNDAHPVARLGIKNSKKKNNYLNELLGIEFTANTRLMEC